jgi:hypothetical protein
MQFGQGPAFAHFFGTIVSMAFLASTW